ncbi:MAG TPA: AsmA-like C-terminal region-containing protein [Methylocella sp.]|nr:AsmA-like C-terminal region-containing protein [Methylocella sp.]
MLFSWMRTGGRLQLSKIKLVLKGRERLVGQDGENPAKPEVEGPRRWVETVARLLHSKQSGIGGRYALRLAGISCKLVFGLLLLAVASAAVLAVRLAVGPLSVNALAPQIADVLDERLGHRYEIGFGDTVLVRDGFMPALSIEKLSIKERSGSTALTVPRAEVAIDPLGLIFGWVTPKRLEVVGVEVHLSLRPDGSVAMPALPQGAETPQATLPSGAFMSAGAAPASPSAVAEARGEDGGPAQADRPPRARLVKRMAATLRQIIGLLTDPESPAAAVKEVGISRGRIIIDDETSGQALNFNGVDLAFDKALRTTKFVLSVDGPNGRWSAAGRADGVPGSQRSLKLSFANLSLDEIRLAAGTRKVGADFDTPLSGKLKLTLEGDGAFSEAAVQYEFGAGYLRFDDPDDEPLMVDRINGEVHWNASSRLIVLGRSQLIAGSTHFAISGSVTPPVLEGDPWLIGLRNAEQAVAGPERPGEKPVLIDRVGLTARLFLDEKKLVLDRFALSGPQCGLAMAGSLDWLNGPHIRLGAAISPTPVVTALRLWPSLVAAPVRSFLLARAHDGILQNGTMQIDYDADDLRAMSFQHAPPDEKSRIDFTLSRATLEFLPGVPPLRGIEGVGHITGRTADVTVTSATVEAADGQVLSLSNARFHMPNTDLNPKPAVVEARVVGSVEAIGKLLSYEAIRPFASLPLDPSTLHGQADGRLEIGMKIGPEAGPGDTTIKIDALVTDFSAERLIGNEKLEAATLTINDDPTGLRANGQGMMLGVPVMVAMTRLPGKPGEATISLILDDALRARQGLGALPGLSGPIGAKISAPIGTGEKLKARIELDLSRAEIDIAGISKPAGRPGKVTFGLAMNDTGMTLDQIIVDAGTVQARGSADLGPDLSLIAAKFPQAKLSPGDDMKIDLLRAGETLKVIVQGSVIDARPFLKSLIFTPTEQNALLAGNGPNVVAAALPAASEEQRNAKSIKEVEFDVTSALLSGFNKAMITGVELRFAKRGEQIQQFSFSGFFGSRPISCNLTSYGSAPQLNLVSEEAGTLLTFLDLYKHMERGRLTVGMRLSSDTLAGVLVIDDFVLHNEPALQRLVLEGAPPRGPDGKERIDASEIAFNKLQVRFHREGSRLDLSDGTMHGEAIGLTVQGSFDLVHDRVDMSGTFVPVYAFNNLFAKIPVFGQILGGGSNEGLIGVNYRITGQASAPTLNINPLSAIAPGIFRQIFGVADFDPMRPQ